MGAGSLQLFKKGSTTMLKQTTVTLSAEEAKIIMEVLRNAPIRGNLETLPSVLNQMLEILKKLDEAFNPQE
jgi:hypothetical protein